MIRQKDCGAGIYDRLTAVLLFIMEAEVIPLFWMNPGLQKWKENRRYFVCVVIRCWLYKVIY